MNNHQEVYMENLIMHLTKPLLDALRPWKAVFHGAGLSRPGNDVKHNGSGQGYVMKQ
jgi:hypothetical protein